MKTAYQYAEGKFEVTPEIKADFNNKGYIFVRNLLSDAEVSKVIGVFEGSDVLSKYSHELDDCANRKSSMCLWNNPGNDVTGMVSKSKKVAGACEKLLGGEVYHYHSKLINKEARTGGRFLWHQDYGYWYNAGCLFPDLMTVFIALDACKRDNGCLQILEGSNRCGRIDHVDQPGGQLLADPERLEQLKSRCPHIYVEMEPGDALFFHSNVLHCSSQNQSDQRRWAFLSAYNRASNNPLEGVVSAFYTKMDKVPNSAILDCQVDWDLDAKDFLTQDTREQWYDNVTHKN